MRIIVTLAGLSLLALQSAVAQAPTAQPAAAPASPANQLGLYAFPSNNQAEAQQLRDEQQRWGWAKEQTGIDPATLKANPDPPALASQNRFSSASQGAAVGGAA